MAKNNWISMMFQRLDENVSYDWCERFVLDFCVQSNTHGSEVTLLR